MKKFKFKTIKEKNKIKLVLIDVQRKEILREKFLNNPTIKNLKLFQSI